ncbi:hypothetical protein [Phytohabitans rumicis]|uniref:Nitroreductase domain-containing protein n=1 Tax=Phytohabitans rumicis TaxID=1076125 RepID=A0A6V8LIA5_9ACTN|nr:hypothetical protein [Phytohabitans rumicis]GFJ94641.1 hypothetical protein Prum_082830 [Phytohabitans rumicis]
MTAPTLDDVTRRLLEQTLVPSPNVTALADRKASAFTERLSAGDDVAELFHVNTKLTRHQADRRFTDAEIAAVRNWYLETCGRVHEEDMAPAAAQARVPHAALPAPVASVLAPFGQDGPPARLLYAVDLSVLLPGGVYRQLPGAGEVWLERRLSSADRDALRRAVPEPAARLLAGDDPVLLVTGVPWRMMLFNGPRGYRRTLMETGVLVNLLGALAAERGLDPRPVFDFYDDELDALLGHDGVEHSLLALLVLRRGEKP